MKINEKNLAKYGMMREAGYTVDEIKREFGESRGKSAKSNDKGDKVMSTHNENKAGINPTVFWNMYDAGKSAKEIAAYFGCSVQTVYNRITKGRSRIKTAKDFENERKFKEIIDRVDSGTVSKKETVDTSDKRNTDSDIMTEVNTIGTIHETPETDNNDNVEGDTGMNTFLGSGRPSGDECADEEIGNGGISGLFKNTKGARAHEAYMATFEENSGVTEGNSGTDGEAAKSDLIDLAFKARYMAHDAGFEPDHLMIDTSEVRDEIIVSGKGSDGKVYEIQFSVTDPMYFSR